MSMQLSLRIKEKSLNVAKISMEICRKIFRLHFHPSLLVYCLSSGLQEENSTIDLHSLPSYLSQPRRKKRENKRDVTNGRKRQACRTLPPTVNSSLILQLTMQAWPRSTAHLKYIQSEFVFCTSNASTRKDKRGRF